MTQTEFETFLKKETYLTSDQFPFPDVTYIYRDQKDNQIKIMYPGDIVYSFDFIQYKNYLFRKVNKFSKNFFHIHEF